MLKEKIMQTGYDFWLSDGKGGYLTIHDGDKQKFRRGSDYRKGGNGFGCGTENVSFTVTVRDRHMIGVFR